MEKTVAPTPFAVQVQATEMAVLGSILKDPSVVSIFIGTLHEQYFCDPRNVIVCRAILELETVGKPIDLLTVFKECDDVEAAYLAELTQRAPVAQNLNHYAVQLLDNHMIIKTMGVLKASLQLGPNIELSRIIAELQAIEELKVSRGDDAMDWGQVSQKIISKLENPDENLRDGFLKQTTFPTLNKMAPLHKGELCIVGAVESGGKTAFAVNLCLGLARGGAKGIYLFYESTPENLQFRIASITTQIPMSKIYNRELSDNEMAIIKAELNTFGDELLYKDKSEKGAILDLIGYVRSRIKKNPCDYIVIDHMHQMPIAGKIREGFIDISRKLLSLAKQENICVIALAQFRKPTEKEFDKRPHRGMIRESSSIAQDAHHIWFLHDPEYLKSKREEQEEPLQKYNNYLNSRGGQDSVPTGAPKHAEIIIDKGREGETGVIPAEFIRQCVTWKELV
jgi:replicative DNA helicase